MPSDDQIGASHADQCDPRGTSKRKRREQHWALALVSAALSLIVATTAAAQTSTYIFTPIDLPPEARPGAVFLTGINNAGQIVGWYDDHGLFYSDGSSFTTIDAPGPPGTFTLGINNTGQIVGCGGSLGGFVYSYSDGTFTTFNVPLEQGYACYQGSGINDLGQIVGAYLYTNWEDIYEFHGFLYSAGNFTTIDAPGALDTYPQGINNAGQIVGYFDGYGTHGYLFDTDGSYTTIDPPGSSYTWVFGINNVGQIVGTFFDSTQAHGFLYVGGSVTLIDVPGALGTNAFAINDAGQIVVRSGDETGSSHWFVATPAQSPDLARLLGRPSSGQPNNMMGGSNVFASPAKSNR